MEKTKAMDCPLISIKNCCVALEGQTILHNLSFQIAKGEHTVIMGANGAGKSLLLRLLMWDDLYPIYDAVNPPVREIMGRTDWSVFEVRQHIGLVSGRIERCLADSYAETVLDAILSGGMGTYGFFSPEDKQRLPQSWLENTHKLIEILGLTGLEGRRLGTLSTGQLRRVMVARALSYEPAILFLDEPTAGLDIVAQRHFMESLRGLVNHVTIILVTHYPEEIFPEIQKMLLMKAGHRLAHGAKKEWMNSRVISEVFDASISVSCTQDGYYSFSLH